MNKVLHISGNTYPPLWQEDHHTKKIWLELAREFDEYHILARSMDNKFSYSQEKNIHLHLLPQVTRRSMIFFITSFFMFYLIKKHKISYLLAQCPVVGGFAAALSSKFYKIPLMVEIHGDEYFRFLKKDTIFRRINSSIMMFVFNKAKKIRSLNSVMTKKLISYSIKGKIVEIPNRVNLSIFNPPKSEYVLHDPLRLVSVGRFVKEKDYLQLIKNLESAKIDYHLTLIGGGVHKEKYLEYISEHRIMHKITLVEWISQESLVSLIRNSDIYIQSSVSEGMPRAIIEAMALRMPIISTTVGSIAGVLADNINSILIAENEEKILTQAILLLISDEHMRRRIANQAYTDVVNKYEWDKVFEKYRTEIINMEYFS